MSKATSIKAAPVAGESQNALFPTAASMLKAAAAAKDASASTAPAKTAAAAKATPAVKAKPVVAKAVAPAKPAPSKPVATKPAAPKPATKTAATPAAPVESDAPDKARKPKLVRDSFTMPEQEYAVLGQVKKACLKAGFDIKKSELLRIGVALISQIDLATLKTVLVALPQLKTGRPKKS